MSLSISDLRLELKLYLSQSILESVVYGCYAITFAMAMHIMMHVKSSSDSNCVRRPIARWDFWILILLFLISTVVTLTDLIANVSSLYSIFGLGGLYPGTSKDQTHKFGLSMQMLAEMGFMFANVLADIILIQRCYIVWNSNFKVVIFPILLSFVNNSIGISAIVMFINSFFNSRLSSVQATRLSNAPNTMLNVFFPINVVSNVLLTALIAGRIWWIMNRLSSSPDFKNVNLTRYKFYISAIIESGSLYPLSVLAFVIILHTVPVVPSLYPVMTTLAGMAPTLILIRVQLGFSVNTLDEVANTLRLTALNCSTRGPRFVVSDEETSGSLGSGHFDVAGTV